LKADRDIMGYF